LSTYDGESDSNFWNCAYKIHKVDGVYLVDSVVNGWINNFFPYGRYRDTRHQFVSIQTLGEKSKQGFEPHKIPKGLTRTPFELVDEKGKSHNMHFIGGFVGVTVVDGQYVTPQVGWAVGEIKPELVGK
jgi:hypothetical protein